MLTALVFILVLSILVLVHELGHFMVAKLFGIKVEEFGFGFPPRLFGFKKGETIYSINALPFGGFVKLYGEDEAGGGKIRNSKFEIQNKDIKRAFFAKNAWQRFLVVIAGVVMNFILAVILISYLFAAVGVAVPAKNIKVVEILKNSPAFEAGIKADDKILSFNHVKIDSVEGFILKTKANLGKPIVLELARGEKTFSIILTPRQNYTATEGPIGVGISNVEIKKYVWYEAPVLGTKEAFSYSWLILNSFGKMIFEFALHGTKPSGVAGPIGVVQLTGHAVKVGLNAVIWFVALLSLNLAVINVLPIPALDGGRLLFIVIEIVARKKVHPKYEAYAHAIGFAILIILIILVTAQDIIRLVSGRSLIPPQ